MLPFGEDRKAGCLLLFNRGLKSRDGLFHRILARLGYQAVVGCMCGSRACAYLQLVAGFDGSLLGLL
jgi:hypothetical protein